MIREYPAYGRTIAQQLVRGLRPICIGVLLSARWWYFDQAPKVCVKPEDWASGKYEFGYLRGRHVVAVWGDGASERQFGELLLELMRAGPSELWAFDASGQKLFDGERDAQGLAWWVWQLLGRDRPLKDPAIHFARLHFEASAAAASRAELTELEAAIARKKPEELVHWHAEQHRIPDRVRQLFSQPFQESGESAAA